MAHDPLPVVRAYHRAWTGKDFARALLAPDLEVEVPINANLDCYLVCSSGWETFTVSIADYCKTGTGRPSPARAA